MSLWTIPSWRQGLLIISLAVLTACSSTGLKEDTYEVEETIAPKTDNEKMAETNVKLAIEYMNLGKYDVALGRLRKAINIDNQYAQAHNVMAILYDQYLKRELDKAQLHYEKAVELAPHNSDILNNYGQFLCKHDSFEKAEEIFKEALNNPVYSKPEYPYTNAGICAFTHKFYDKADTYLRTALQLNSRFPSALYYMAKLHHQTDDNLTARDYLLRYQETAKHTCQSLWLSVQVSRALNDINTQTEHTMLLRSQCPDSNEVQQLNYLQDLN